MSAIVLLSLPLSLLAFSVVATWAVMDAAWRGTSPAEVTIPRRRVRAQLPVEMAKTIGQVIGAAPVIESQVTCSDSAFIPQVTELEARAIVEDLRRQGPDAVEQVLERSRASDGICPMRNADGFCACSAIRPLECLGRCLAGGDSPEWAAGLGQSMSAAFRQHLKDHHEDSATRRLNEAMLSVLASPRSTPVSTEC